MDTTIKILLLTDFSEVSENATNYTLQIAKSTNAKVHVMHVINTPVEWVKIPLENEKLYPETKAEIGMAKFKLNEITRTFDNEGVEVNQSLVYNLGVEDIAGHIESKNFDLIVMGSHGSKGGKPFYIGSNVYKVLRTVSIPTLVLRQKPKNNAIENIAFASTFEKDQKNAYNKILKITELFGAQLHLISINTPYNFIETEEMEERLTDFCKASKDKCIWHTFNALNEERGIRHFLHKTKVDIFSMATAGKSDFVQIFSPSLTEHLINKLEIPILSIHK